MTQDPRSPQSAGVLQRLANAAQMFRPRTIAQLTRNAARLQQQIHDLDEEVKTLKAALAVVIRKERQLRTVLETEYASADGVSRFEASVRDLPIAEHVRAAIAGATLELDPFPHCIVDRLLPDEYYGALVAAIPPADLFADRPENKQQLPVPLEFAPRYSMEVWRHMTRLAETAIKPAVLAKFHQPLTEWLRQTLPVLGDAPLEQMRITCSDGRLLRRGPGYVIPPHRDPKWGFITCLMYLARPGDDETWGTQFYRVEGDQQTAGARPHWIDPNQCRLVKDVAFLPNRALIFLNSVGAHGAQIPKDAQPPSLERYAYQFRIGADGRSIKAIRDKLPPDLRALWAGKVDDDYQP